jgi:hypothetical protein
LLQPLCLHTLISKVLTIKATLGASCVLLDLA